MLTRFQQSRGITLGTDTLMKIQAYPEKEASTLILGFRDGSRVQSIVFISCKIAHRSHSNSPFLWA